MFECIAWGFGAFGARGRAGLGLVALCAILPAAASLARPASLEGQWRLDLRESEMLSPQDTPASLVMTVTKDDGKAFRWTVAVKMPDGAAGTTGFDGAIDGKPRPVQGRPGSTSTFSWTPDGLLKQVSESKAGIAVELCAISADGRKMTCNARQTDVRGNAATYVEVFDKL
jgi:hypothetical protein